MLTIQVTTPLSRYHSLFNHFLKDLSELVLIDKNGEVQLSEGKNIVSSIPSLISNLDDKIQWKNTSQTGQYLALDDSIYIYLLSLKLGADENLYWLSLIVDQSATEKLSAGDIELIFQTLGQISVFIIDDYNQTLIINGMSDELATRYEELNLLYGMDAGFNIDEMKTDEEIYEAIVDDCCDYMGVELACLIMEGKEPIVANHNSDITKDKLSLVLNKFQGPLYTVIAAEPATLVINKNEVIDWTNPELGIDFKYIAVPIFKSLGRMTGILVIANHDDKKSFTNSDRKLSEVLAAEISKLTQARHDALTGLLNRKGFERRLRCAIRKSFQQSKMSAMIYLDVDQFQLVNELSGHHAGDVLLQQIASLLPTQIRTTDTLARLGGDEFALILENCPLSKALAVAGKINEQIQTFRFVFLDKVFDVTVSVGIVLFGDEEKDIKMVMGEAESACFTAKEMGRNQVRVYEANNEVMTKRRDDVLWISRIHNAIEENRFRIYRQQIKPIQPDDNGDGHYEILLRMIDEQGNIISPFGFIPAAERYDQMTKLDRWVIEKALDTILIYDKKVGNQNLSLSINLSGQSLCEDGFSSFIVKGIQSRKIDPARLCFEITETAAIVNLSYALKFIEKVKKIGCSFSLDDFGSGMSSFGYLKNLPVDYLKIDGHFVKTMLKDPVDFAMVESIHHIGHVMGLKTIAEFVESEDMFEPLIKIGVDYIQGYAIGKPEPFDP